jgi:putative phosphoribosyl transferase
MAEIHLDLDGTVLPGTLTVPAHAAGLVVFAHGSGSSRHSPRNRMVAEGLVARGLATLLFDLLTEDEGNDRARVFDIPLLGTRTAAAVDAVATHAPGLPVGLFGASTGAAAALDAAAVRPDTVRAVVSRGGRPDLATRLRDVRVPVLLIVGGDDRQVLALNRDAAAQLTAPEVVVVPRAGHLFEGPGQLEEVTRRAGDFLLAHLPGPTPR